MESGDGDAARRLMEAHVLSAGEALGSWLANTARETGTS
jgi:DNA-binding GntR family transcriptional regulator